KVRIMTIVAISCPPAIIDGELRQACESPSNQSLIYPRCSAAHQSTKRIEIYRSRSMGNQVRVEKLMVSDFIIRIVVNVLRHVFIKRVEGVSIECITCPARYLGILDSARARCIESKSRLPEALLPRRTSAALRRPVLNPRGSLSCLEYCPASPDRSFLHRRA